MEEGKRWDLFLLFFSLFFAYNAYLRPIAAMDSIPARLLPFSLLREGNLDLDEFGFGSASQSQASSLPYFVVATRGHIMSFYPVVLPVVISPLYLPAVWVLRAYGKSFVDPN